MRTVTVPGIDIPLSVITFGCWQIAPSEGWGDVCSPEDADRVVKTALDGGITAFDTAEGYGDGESERRLGKALGSKKNDVVIVSKILPDAELTLAAYQARLEGTLKALGRDYVDVYMVHWPGGYIDTGKKTAKLCDIMAALKESGKARTVGISNFMARDIGLMAETASLFTLNQVPYNILQREYEGEHLRHCEKYGIGYMAYSPGARGLLGGRTDDEALKAPTRQDYFLYRHPYFSDSKIVSHVVQQIAEEINTVPFNVAIAWVIHQKNIKTAVVGSRKPEQVSEFCAAGDLVLTEDQLGRLKKASDLFLSAGGSHGSHGRR